MGRILKIINGHQDNVYHQMIEKLPFPVMLHRKDGKIIKINNSFTEITGYEISDVPTMKEWLNKTPNNSTIEKVRENITKLFTNQNTNEDLVEITTKNPKNVKWRFQSVALDALDEGSPVIMSIGRNIDYQYKLQELNEDLKRSNEDLEQFAYVASHDLQEPLRVIHGFIELIEQDISNYMDKDIEYMFNTIKRATTRMQKLIDDLLKFSRLGRKEYTEEVDLSEIAETIINNLENMKDGKNIDLQIDELPVVIAEYTEVYQLFQNLISNAIKFNNNQPVIRISYEDLDDTHYLKFSDNGIGIDEKHRESIFIIFKRLHNKKEYTGTGLGLALVKKVVDLLQGEIWITSPSEGTGSVFHIQFPKKL